MYYFKGQTSRHCLSRAWVLTISRVGHLSRGPSLTPRDLPSHPNPTFSENGHAHALALALWPKGEQIPFSLPGI